VTALVPRLYEEVLGWTPSPDDVAWWRNTIGISCDMVSAVAVFFNAIEYLGAPRTLAEHVMTLYKALLGRRPDGVELQGWENYLAWQLAMIEDVFIHSAEFQARFQALFP
jgi:hypothetical protein